MTTTTSNSLTPIYGQETSERNWLQSKVLAHLSLATVLLIGIMLLAAVLNFANISTIGDANVYYTAAVKSMLQSFSNFFFVAAEPGGSVSVDKPPLGLWLQAISALIFGVNGFAVTLPQMLAGIFSIPVLYVLVKRYFGSAAGLIAAFVLAVTPVAIAAQRNNTMDATLIFTLLLAAWAFIKGTESGKLRWLLLGGVLVGLGFNIKMLQAFLPLPAFYALYFLGAKVGWWRKIGHLVATTVVLLAVSLSWVAIVDLTPADQRPYVGSSSTNSALELAIGYNGLERLFGGVIGGGGGATLPSTTGGGFGMPANTAPDATNGFAPPADDGSNSSTDGTDGRGGLRPDDGGRGSGGGGIGTGEIGQASITRLVTTPLANEVSWLLPFGLFSVGLLVVASRVRLPLSDAHKGAVLFGGWLLTEVVFFSAASFFHAYYLAMLAPPLAALIGIGVLRLWKLRDQHHLLASLLLIAVGAGTLLFQISVASQYTSLNSLWWTVPAVVLLVIGALLLLQRVNVSRKLMIAGFVCIVGAMTLVPTVWAGLTTLDTGNNTTLPHAYSGTSSSGGFAGAGRDDDGMAGGFGNDRSVNSELLTYLQANTQDTRYLVAVQSSMQGDPYILATGRPVLLMGGFSGSDPVVDATDLQRLVDNGELRYILYGGGRGGQGGNSSSAISTWLQASCTVVTDVSSSSGTLYQCLPTTTGS